MVIAKSCSLSWGHESLQHIGEMFLATCRPYPCKQQHHRDGKLWRLQVYLLCKLSMFLLSGDDTVPKIGGEVT